MKADSIIIAMYEEGCVTVPVLEQTFYTKRGDMKSS